VNADVAEHVVAHRCDVRVVESGVDGCTYQVIGNSLSSIPECWGLGAGPYAGLPLDQIEVRLRSDFSGSATLRVADVHYGP
jgi:hypothetical protein